jgi:cystathionine beta-lyase
MIYDFDQVIDRRSSDSGKWNRYDPDVLPLWVADMDFVTPEPILRALRERVDHGIFGYPDIMSPDSLPEFRQVIIDRLLDLYSWEVKPRDLTFIPGVVRGFNIACHAFAETDGGVLVQPPVYSPILKAPGNAGMIKQEALLVQGEGCIYEIDWEIFEGAITDKTRLFILCNPHNPVSRVFSREELERMAEICLQHDVLICSDEIHCDLLFSGQEHVPIASLDPVIADNTITLIAPSKTFNIAGLQCSIAIVQNAGLRRKLENSHKGLVSWVNVLGLVAGEAAYREGQEWLGQLLQYLEANRDYLYEFVKRELPSISMALPEGTYLAWLDCKDTGMKGTPCEFFIENAQVALNDGEEYGTGGKGFVRLNFACPRSILIEALERMKSALDTL